MFQHGFGKLPLFTIGLTFDGLLLRIEHDVDIITRQRESGYTDHVVDPNRHGAFAISDHGG